MFEIVVIDDEKAVLSAIQRELRDPNYNLQCFTNPSEALDHCISAAPDLVLSDVRMPHMDGVELMSELNMAIPDASRILMSGHSDKDSVIDAINTGHIHFFIEKPWGADELVQTVEKALEISRIKKENIALTESITLKNEELEILTNHLDKKVAERTQELHEAYAATINTFSSLVEKRFKSYKHSSRDVALLCYEIAVLLKLSEHSREILHQAAMLRNIGKLGFPDDLLSTPVLKMEEDKKEIFFKHPIHAQVSLSMLPPLKEASQILLQHQECEDGTGYPRQLNAEEIEFESKVLKVCSDFFEAKNGLWDGEEKSDQDALSLLKENKNKYENKVLATLLVYFGHEKKEEKPGKQIPSHALKPGMQVSRDLYSDTGVLLLVKNKILTQSMIDHINTLESNSSKRFDIHIYL